MIVVRKTPKYGIEVEKSSPYNRPRRPRGGVEL